MISGVHDNSIISFINFKNDNIFVSVEVIITTKNSSLERLGLESLVDFIIQEQCFSFSSTS